MISTILALSLIAQVQAAPTIATDPMEEAQSSSTISQMALNHCASAFAPQSSEFMICTALQNDAYNDIQGIANAIEFQGISPAPILRYCVETTFVGPNQIDLTRVRKCVYEAVGIVEANND